MAHIAVLGFVGLATPVFDVIVNGIWSDHGVSAALHLPGRGLSVLGLRA